MISQVEEGASAWQHMGSSFPFSAKLINWGRKETLLKFDWFYRTYYLCLRTNYWVSADFFLSKLTKYGKIAYESVLMTEFHIGILSTYFSTIHSGTLSFHSLCITNCHIFLNKLCQFFCYCSLLGQHFAQCSRIFLHCPGKVNTSTRTLHIANILA